MSSDTSYYFSKWTFLFTTLFIGSVSAGIIYYSLLFYPDAWQYSLLFAIPLLLILFTLPGYLRVLYFLATKKPALILTTEKLIDNFKREEYKWSEIIEIGYKLNEGRAPGSYTAVYLKDLRIIKIADIRLKCKKEDLMRTLNRFHNRYKNK